MLSVLKQLKIDKRIRTGYAAAFILLFISYLLTLYANRQLIQETKTIINTNHTIIHLQDLTLSVKDAETGVRGYLLMKDKNFLGPYNDSKKKADSIFSLLASDFGNEPIFQNEIAGLKKLVAKKYQYLAFALQNYVPNSLSTSDTLIKTGHKSEAVMDSIDTAIKMLQLKKADQLIKNTQVLNSRYSTMNFFIITSLFLVFLFAFFGLLTYIRENNARVMADKKVIKFQHQLQLRIDELNAANKELIEMRRIEKFAATGRIARNIAHEVRNPLTNIDLAIGQIRSELPPTDDNFTLLFDMVNRNSKRINQLITELLNATRFAELNYQPIGINTILEDALKLAEDRLTLTHIEIQKNYAHNIPEIIADKEKLQIAFLNIIVNAVEAMEKEGGILKINTRSEIDKCIVEIIDNGIGMDAIALSKLFEPYFTSKPKGNGLGLTNTQNIILNHKGTLNVESTPGMGTTFTIRFYFNHVS